MKKILYLLMCFACTCVFSSCRSEKEKITENYILSTDYPYAEDIAEKAHGIIISFGIDDFNDVPVDTLYEWQIFEKYDLQNAIDVYAYDIAELEGMYEFRQGMIEAFGDLYDNSPADVRINEMILQAEQDSLVIIDMYSRLEKMKVKKAVYAYGYVFTEIIGMNVSGRHANKLVKKIIYITDDGTVYACKNF